MIETRREARAREAETAKAAAAAAARPVPKARQNTEYDVTPGTEKPLTAAQQKAADEQKKVQEEAIKLDVEVQTKVAKINANLSKDGSSRRIRGDVRNGEARYYWANEPVPTQELDVEELRAIDAIPPAPSTDDAALTRRQRRELEHPDPSP
jgi:hypothetical protein